ncbi:MAG TPA: type II toxin-antitoxin system VapC family toxin [Thermoanaerobaculia bacterium]
MTPLVVDASALLEYLLGSPAGARIAPLLQSQDADLHAPALCDVEIGSGLVRLLARRRIGVQRATELLEDLGDMPLARHGHLSLVPRALALRENFSIYDGVYVALAESLGATLVTADAKLARAARTHSRVDVQRV